MSNSMESKTDLESKTEPLEGSMEHSELNLDPNFIGNAVNPQNVQKNDFLAIPRIQQHVTWNLSLVQCLYSGKNSTIPIPLLYESYHKDTNHTIHRNRSASVPAGYNRSGSYSEVTFRRRRSASLSNMVIVNAEYNGFSRMFTEDFPSVTAENYYLHPQSAMYVLLIFIQIIWILIFVLLNSRKSIETETAMTRTMETGALTPSEWDRLGLDGLDQAPSIDASERFELSGNLILPQLLRNDECMYSASEL